MKMESRISSYMELCLHLEGRGDLYLRVPTVWDAVKNQWIGFVKTPKTQKLITGTGKDSFDLQNNFNIAFSEFLQNPETAEEGLSMFNAKEFWEK